MCEISIVVPIYNKAQYLSNTIKSILSQSFKDFELLLIDDGSTDDSGMICDRFALMDSRVKTFHNSNLGVSAARNYGIEKAKGVYISFIDADDYVEKDYLYKLYKATTNNSADMAMCDYYEMKGGKKINHCYQLEEIIDNEYEIVRHYLLGVLWNKLFVRKNIKHLFEEGISTCEDSIFCVQYYIDNRPKIAYVNEVLYGYLRNSEGLTASYDAKSMWGINKYCSLYYVLVKHIEDDVKRKVAIHSICRIYFYLIYSFVIENICVKRADSRVINNIDNILNSRKYQRIIKNVLLFPIKNSMADKTSIKEMIYIFLSILRMKRCLLAVAKVKRTLRPLK